MTTYTEITNQIADQWVAALKNAEATVAKLSENAQRVVEASRRRACPPASRSRS